MQGRGMYEISDTMYIQTLVVRDKFTYNRYYGSHSNFKPKQVDTVSLAITATELQAIKAKNRTQRDNQTKVIGLNRPESGGTVPLSGTASRCPALQHFDLAFCALHSVGPRT